jgi:hypothetical protein
MEEKKKPQAGEWDNIKPYPERIKFVTDIPVKVEFSEDFDKPQELPNKDGNGVFYVFPCKVVGADAERCISTSSWTLLQGLRTKMPLSNKKLEITKKVVAGKNQFYISVLGEDGELVDY